MGFRIFLLSTIVDSTPNLRSRQQFSQREPNASNAKSCFEPRGLSPPIGSMLDNFHQILSHNAMFFPVATRLKSRLRGSRQVRSFNPSVGDWTAARNLAPSSGARNALRREMLPKITDMDSLLVLEVEPGLESLVAIALSIGALAPKEPISIFVLRLQTPIQAASKHQHQSEAVCLSNLPQTSLKQLQST
jgi:hypothetical protein